MSCEQIDAQMVDFLYGELPAVERAAFEAHLAGCARCRAEVEAFGGTRTLARAALDDAPPPRARAAIVRAAREAISATPPAKVPPPRASFWDWLRGHWAFPTLATVGALTAFLLGSRLFLNPKATYERGRSALAPSAPPESASQRPSSTAAAEVASDDRDRAATGAELERKVAEPSANRAAADRDQALRTLGALGQAAKSEVARADDTSPSRRRLHKSPAEKPKEGSYGAGATLRAASAKDDGDAPEDPLSSRVGGGRGGISDSVAKEDGAPAASSAGKAGAGAAAPAKKSAVARARVIADDSVALDDPLEGNLESDRDKRKQADGPREFARPPARGAAPPSPPAPATISRAAPMAASSESAAAPEPTAGAEEKASAETLVQRADRLFTQGRWAQAAVAYRDLLRQRPNAPDADRWRKRLAAARAAITSDRPPPGP